MLTDQNEKKPLFSEFSPVPKAKWVELINKESGADLDKLSWDTLEGFTVPPFYTREDVDYNGEESATFPHLTTNWKLCEKIYDSDPKKACQSIIKAQKAGADACLIKTEVTQKTQVLEGDIIGTNLQFQDDVNILAEKIGSDFEIIFDCGMASPAMLAMVENTGRQDLRLSSIFDPFTYTARNGRLPVPENRIHEIIQNISGQGDFTTLCADAAFYHNSGASIVQELGIALALGSEFLASVQPENQQKTANSLFVRLASGPLYFPEMAKFRALRLLWRNLLEAYDLKNPKNLRIFAETSRFNKPVADAHNNIIRSVTEGMSAIKGGADILMIHPYNSGFNQPDDHSKRISRNIQHILREEAFFDKSDDPAAGSYYVENLTNLIAENAWNFFRQIEKEGGFMQALRNGSIQNEIRNSSQLKLQSYNTGSRVLVGSNHYADPAEELPVEDINPGSVTSLIQTPYQFEPENGDEWLELKKAFREGAGLADVMPSYLQPQKVLYTVIEEFQAGFMFDEVRYKTDSYIKNNNKRPVVNIIPAGDAKSRNSRTKFAQHVFGCAGFEVRISDGFDAAEDSFTANESETADMYVLCSSDKEFPEYAGSFSEKFSGKGILILAAEPGEKEDEFKKSGINYFLYRGMNLPLFLSEIQDELFKEERE